ncbi:hypothetical protein DKK70_09605 [Gilliamella apicola]|uniref:Uncharacterized protein n=1 Tax=Gilliamella apicola TaxID=1196095 RepID=A0A2V4E181_9GAMM|nr:hypothetical protein [Gilliamella apicola]PXZ06905.1 hypothetical protein DKK70_09605 [Gilliamella apicola]
MAGAFVFSEKNVAAFGSTFIDVLADYWRPYIQQIGVDKKVYFYYDLFYGNIDFSELTQKQYIQCYKQIEKAIEVDLERIENFYNHYPKELVYKAWFEEIKPKMQSSPLYQS